jgi:hypothetical protein
LFSAKGPRGQRDRRTELIIIIDLPNSKRVAVNIYRDTKGPLNTFPAPAISNASIEPVVNASRAITDTSMEYHPVMSLFTGSWFLQLVSFGPERGNGRKGRFVTHVSMYVCTIHT